MLGDISAVRNIYIVCGYTDMRRSIDGLATWCNTDMKAIGKEIVREELQYIPAQLKVLRYVRYAYECPSCRKDGTPVIVKAYVPKPVLKHSIASASTVAHVMYQKYVNAMPLYRQEKEWKQLGVELSRATLANWMICASRSWLTPIVNYMKNELLKRAKPILDAFWSWLETVTALKNSKLNKAVIYAWNQKEYLENYLLDGRCSLSNNIAENSIRPFCIGRKNWLFSDSVKGAESSAAIYTIIETAKANEIEPMHYLQFLFTYMPGADINDTDMIEAMMPWSNDYKEFIN